MVECGRLPGGGGMAGITEGAKFTIMCVVLGVTGNTGRVKGSEDVFIMALCAYKVSMGTGQREI